MPPDLIEGHHVKPLPPPEIIGGEERYEVDEVLDSRMKGRKLQYLVRWRGYGHKENSWIPEEDLDAAKLIANSYRAHLNAPKQINTLTFGQMGFRPRYPHRQNLAHRDAVP
jgi:hypothetical protein